MKLLEYESKNVFVRCGIPVPRSGGVVRRPSELGRALKRAGRGPWVLKAQVLAGGRGKAGGIVIAKTAREAKLLGQKMLSLVLRTAQTGSQGIPVREVLVEQAVPIEKEFYLSATLDRSRGVPVLMASAQGGVDIEELARTSPQDILRQEFDPVSGLRDFEAREAASRLGVGAAGLVGFAKTARTLCRLFLDLDCSLVEINPLAWTKKGEFVALDSKLVVDDSALPRHPEVGLLPDHESSPLEKAAKKVGISYIGLGGNIGCLVNGAGLAMGTMDTIKLAGGEPANFLDVGGGANVSQVKGAFKILLKDPNVKAVLVNIFGGIMKCDTIAQGILEAVRGRTGLPPIVVRLEGTRVVEGRKLLADSGVPLAQASTLWDAAKKVVSLAGGS